MLLTQLRYFGFHFNPVNFYYCYDGEDTLRWFSPKSVTRRGMNDITTR